MARGTVQRHLPMVTLPAHAEKTAQEHDTAVATSPSAGVEAGEAGEAVEAVEVVVADEHPAVADDYRLELLIAGCPDAYLEVDRTGVIVEWNDGAEERFGWRRGDVLGKFMCDTALTGPFARSPFGLLMSDSSGTAIGPVAGSVNGGTLDLVLELRHQAGHRVRSEARLVIIGDGRSRSVAGFLRLPAPALPMEPPSKALAPADPPVELDPLTGLASRSAYLTRLAATAADHTGMPGSVAVILLDLDRFKAINNSMGLVLGDWVLAAVARRLEEVAAGVDLLARFGGDEFLGLVVDQDGAQVKAAAFIERVKLAFSAPFPVEGAEVFLDASVGVALNTFGTDDPDELLAHAEAAMYQAKRRGGFGVETFGEALRIEALDRPATEHALRRAVERSELLLHYQPVVEVQGATTVGVEALIRWQHPDQGLVPPGRFISVAEESGLIIPIGAWVLDQACHQLRDWHQRGPVGPRGSVEVNLSARQIDDPGIVSTVEEVLARTGLAPEHLTLEITESALMKDAASALVVLRALKELGVLLAIDDFGTGYSSLSYLQRFPLDILKVDRMFVAELDQGAGGNEIVSAVIKLAHALGLLVVAEGVETEQQFEILRTLECDFAQGYLFSRPVPAHELRGLFGEDLSV